MRERPGFNHKGVFVMGIIHLAAGVLSIIFGGVQIGVRSQLGFIGYGIWCGAIYCVPGALGITSWRFKNNGNIISLMVMCIISSITAFTMLCLSVASLIIDLNYRPYYGDHYYRCSWCNSAVYAEVTLLILSLLVFVTSIVCAAFCCKAVCCGPRTQATGTVIGYANNTQQVVYPGQQVMFVPAQGMQPQYLAQGYGQGQAVMAPAGAIPQQGYVYNQPQVMAAGQPQVVYSAPQQAVTPQPQVGQPQASGGNPPVYTSLEENAAKEGSYNYTQLQN